MVAKIRTVILSGGSVWPRPLRWSRASWGTWFLVHNSMDCLGMCFWIIWIFDMRWISDGDSCLRIKSTPKPKSVFVLTTSMVHKLHKHFKDGQVGGAKPLALVHVPPFVRCELRNWEGPQRCGQFREVQFLSPSSGVFCSAKMLAPLNKSYVHVFFSKFLFLGKETVSKWVAQLITTWSQRLSMWSTDAAHLLSFN